MFNRQKVTGLILGGIAALGITAGATTAFAQSTDTGLLPAFQLMADEDTLNADELAPRGPGFGNRGMQGGEMLANALGLTPAELQTAMQKIPELAIAQAVENGDITQEQADQMQQGRGMRGMMGIKGNLNQDELLAEALGITPEELATARENEIPMAVEAGLLTQAQANDLLVQKRMQDAVKTAREEALQQAVEDGLLTQAQADRMLEQGGGHGFGPGMRGNQRGGHGGFNEQRGAGGQRGPGGQRDNAPGNQPEEQSDGQSSFPVAPDAATTQASEL